MPLKNLSPGACRMLFENSVDAVLLTVPDGSIVAANPAACTIFQMTEAELCAAGRDRLVDTSDPRFSVYRGELTCRRKDGSTFQGEASSVILDDEGTAFFIIRDLTAQKQADEALRTTLESIGDGFFAVDADWRFVYINATAERLLGIRRDEVLGRSHWEVFPLTLGTRLETEYRRAAAGKVRDWENLYEPWGRWFHHRCFPRQGGGMVVYIRDITERKQREEDLRQTHALLEGITNGTEDMIAAEDGEFRYLFFNEAYRREFKALWGRNLEVGTSMIEALAPWPEEQRKARELWGRALAGESLKVRMDFGPERERRIYDLHFNPVRDSQGRQIGAAHILRNVTEQVRMEQTLAQSEGQARRIIDNTVALVGIMTTDGTLIEANATALRAGGLQREDVVGKKFWECYWWSYDVQVQAQLRAAVAKGARGEIVRYDVVVRTAGDGRMAIDFMLAPARDSAGQITHLIPSALDISERKRAEEALAQSEELVRTIAENSTQALMMMDERGFCTYANPASLTMTGYTAEELCSRPLHDLVHHHYPDGQPYPLDECPLDRALPENFDVRAHRDLFFRKDGTPFPVLCAASPIFKGGRPVATVLEVRDITEAERREATLRESEERFRTTFDQVAVGMAHVDLDGRFLRLNQKLCEIVGYSPEEMQKKTFMEVTFPEDLDQDLALADKLLRGEINHYQIEKRYIRKDGQTVWVNLSGAVQRSADGIPQFYIAVVEDISDRKSIEHELIRAKWASEEASRAKSEFLANMSHEIRTPMTVFMAAIEHLLQLDRNPDRRELLEMADQSAARLRVLIDDILDFSRIEARKVALEEEPFDLGACVHEVVKMFAPQAKGKNLRLEWEIAPEIPERVVGDPNRLSQVLINLIGNAVKFTQEGEIRVCVRPRGDFVEFAVADTGIGFPEEKRDLLFESFTQADSSFTRKFGGAGLGLGIAKGLVNLMGGELSVQGREGQGSVFTFTIPLKSAGRQSGSPCEALSGNAGDILASRILLVEDDPMIRNMIAMMLAQRGWQTETAENGREAVAKWEGGEFDLVLMDVQMPEMNGLEATRTIRQKDSAREKHTWIIGLTAHAQREIRDDCLEAGMDKIVTKPIKVKDLYSAICDCLK
jgi:PAS domain S-box-containing protein